MKFLPLLTLLGLTRAEVILQLFEWRFDDIAQECATFLKNRGYTAVQTSPVSEHAVLPGRPWYERYQPFSYRIKTRSGDEQAFTDMVHTCNQNGIKVYVDVTQNHMSSTQPEGTVGTAGSRPHTGGKLYPNVPYGPNDFHQTCSIDNWNDKNQVQNCELVGLHDLNQDSEYVRGKLVEYLNHLVDIGVAGFRVDAAKHVPAEQLAAIFSKVRNLNGSWFPGDKRPYVYQEIAGNPDTDVIKPRDYFAIGSAMDFKYGYELSRAFLNQNQLKWYKTFGESWGLLPWTKSVVFIDNHDTQRDGFMGIQPLSYKQSKQYKMAVGFMLSWPHGVARVMSSFAFEDRAAGPPHDAEYRISRVIRNQDLSCGGGWVCEHRWRPIYSMVEFRNLVQGSEVRDWWDNGNYQVAFCRGNKGFVAFNADSSPLDSRLQTCLPEGVYCDVVSGMKTGSKCTGRTITVAADGMAQISLKNDAEDGFLAIHVKVKMSSPRSRQTMSRKRTNAGFIVEPSEPNSLSTGGPNLTSTSPSRLPKNTLLQNRCNNCNTNHCFTMVHNRSTFTDMQMVKLQESPDDMPAGQTPHTVTLFPHIVDRVTPGQRVSVTGIYRAIPYQLNPRNRNLKSVNRTHIDVLHYHKDSSKYLHETDSETNRFTPTPERLEVIRALSTRPDLYERLANSIAPSVYENDDIKKGILLQLFGGTRKTYHRSGRTSFRSELNVLLCRDLCTSKSQFLSYVYNLVLKSQYTSGKASSAMGLTAYVTKDLVSRQFVLQTGDLVLADNGVCCIDEFDKMNEATRSVLHEVISRDMFDEALKDMQEECILKVNARHTIKLMSRLLFLLLFMFLFFSAMKDYILICLWHKFFSLCG